MTNTQFPTASGVALTIGGNVRKILAVQGHTMEWLADQIDISVHTILDHFAKGVPAWLTLDILSVLNVPAWELLDVPAPVEDRTYLICPDGVSDLEDAAS